MTAPFAAGRLANVSGAVLIGGASRRMGRDKARIELDGEPLATRLARMLDALCTDVLLVGGTAPAEAPGRRVPDPPLGDRAERSALRGLVGALAAARAERVLVLATDMPWMRTEVLLALVAWPEHDAVVARDAQGRMHPLCGIYRRESALAVARRNLEAGRHRLRHTLDALDTAWLEGEALRAVDPDGRALVNVNTPEELRDARARFS